MMRPPSTRISWHAVTSRLRPLLPGGGVLNGNDIGIATAHVQELRLQSAAGQRPELGEEVVSYRGPAPVGTCNGAGTRQHPDRVVGEAAGGGLEVAISDRGVEAPHDVDGTGIFHSAHPLEPRGSLYRIVKATGTGAIIATGMRAGNERCLAPSGCCGQGRGPHRPSVREHQRAARPWPRRPPDRRPNLDVRNLDYSP